jgi:CO/xanthine dehydrogenase FAD-binding subunit
VGNADYDPLKLWRTYLQPHNLDEALQALSQAQDSGRIIAGGTDLVLDIKNGRQSSVDTMIDITQIPQLIGLEIRQDNLFIGAATPLSQIIKSQLAVKYAQVLVDACSLIAGPQVRNVATLGGNVAHGLPAADGTIAMVALDVKVEIYSLIRSKCLPLKDLFVSPGKTIIDPSSEIVSGFYIPLNKLPFGSAFKRVMRAQGIALPILNLAVSLTRIEKHIERLHIAIGPGGPTPWRALQAEQIMTGQEITQQNIDSAYEAILTNAKFRSSPHRASAEYRRHLSRNLFEQALQTAWLRASKSDYRYG